MNGKNNIFNVSSNSQSGGITAGIVNLGPNSRHIDDGVKSQLKNTVDKSKKVVITAVLGDPEAFNFAHEVLKFLQDEQYNAEGVNQAIYSKPVIGQFIEQKPGQVNIVIGSGQN